MWLCVWRCHALFVSGKTGGHIIHVAYGRRNHGMPYKNPADRRARQMRRYHARKSEGLCPECPSPSMVGSVYCPSCRERNRKRSNANNPKYRELLKARGLCVRCSGELDDPDKKTCMNCRMHAHEGRPYR